MFTVLSLISCKQQPAGQQQDMEDWVLLSRKQRQFPILLPWTKSPEKMYPPSSWPGNTKRGDLKEKGNTQIQCNPLIISGVLYGPALP